MLKTCFYILVGLGRCDDRLYFSGATHSTELAKAFFKILADLGRGHVLRQFVHLVKGDSKLRGITCPIHRNGIKIQ